MCQTPIQPSITRLQYEESPCNCIPSCHVNNNCPYNGRCRASCIVYKATCNETRKFYIGNTRRAYKKRIPGEYSDVRILVLTGKKSDSFASHFATFFNTESKPTPTLLRQKMTSSTIARQSSFSTEILRYEKLPPMYKRKHPHPKKPTH